MDPLILARQRALVRIEYAHSMVSWAGGGVCILHVSETSLHSLKSNNDAECHKRIMTGGNSPSMHCHC
jgi:hypothetical protein